MTYNDSFVPGRNQRQFYHDLQQRTAISTATSLFRDPDKPDPVRQEFKADADVNTILKRFGVEQRQVTYGEADTDLDLQGALEAVRSADEAFQGLPKNLRDKYRNMKNLLNAIESGALKLDMRPEGELPPLPKTKEQLEELRAANLKKLEELAKAATTVPPV